MERFEPDLVHCDSLFSAHVHPSAPAAEATWVLSLQNDEALLKERLAATAGEWLRRALYRREARALGELQRRYLATFDHCVAVSDTERERFESQGAESAIAVPNGVAPLPEPDGPPRAPEAGEPLRLLFVGSLELRAQRPGPRVVRARGRAAGARAGAASRSRSSGRAGAGPSCRA